MPITKIETIHVHKFRLFQEVKIPLGDKVTVIAGHNATGKSTLLSLLGHCAELKKKDGKPILLNQFRTEFSEIIKASPNFDQKTSLAYTLRFRGNEEVVSLPFRTTWQDNGTRFRIIPKKTAERQTERKLEWPTLYLGLSRLYPVGESEQHNSLSVKLTVEHKAELFQAHRNILSLYEEPRDYAGIALREKETVGIVTDSYDYICNSAGQDNVSQIVMAILSFKALKEKMGDEWKGGLFLIDEFDAALHPAAQNKLFKYLYDSAKVLEIQIAFTTHSLSLLETICKKTANNGTGINNIELIYITTRHKVVEVSCRESYTGIFYDMLNQTSSDASLSKILIYSEDNEARWFIQKLLQPLLHRIELSTVSMGDECLLGLYKDDPGQFRKNIFILDGDTPQNDIDRTIRSLPFPDVKNILKLPIDGVSPEKAFFSFLNQVLQGNAFEQARNEICSTGEGFSYRTIIMECGPDSYTGYTDERDKYKQWFRNFLPAMDAAYPHWEKENKDTVNDFRREFCEAYNYCARWIRLPGISAIPFID